jgi:tetratricopeptide (TPR) repeat protein
MRNFLMAVMCALAMLACAPQSPENNTLSEEATDTPQAANEEKEDAPERPREAAYPHQVLKELAQVYLKYGILDEAIRHYRLAAQVQFERTGQQDAEIYAGLGDAFLLLIQHGDPTHREEYRQHAAAAFRDAVTILEQVYKERGPELIEEPIQHNQLVARISRIYALLGEDDKRREWLARLRADENNWQQQTELALIHEQLERYERAEERFKRALELTVDDAASRAQVEVRYAALLNKLERGDEAIALARAVIANEEADDEARRLARRLLFDIYDARGELDKLDFK